MDALFRFSSAVEHDPAVDAWLAKSTDVLHAIASTWFERMRACGDDVRELMHDHMPTACVEDAAFAYVNVFKAHVNVGFFRGSELDDPAGLLEGTGKRMRHVKLKPGAMPDEAALQQLITTAYEDMRARVGAG